MFFFKLKDCLRNNVFYVATVLYIGENLMKFLFDFRHMQEFWGASGDFWQRRWEELYLLFNQDDFLLSVFGE